MRRTFLLILCVMGLASITMFPRQMVPTASCGENGDEGICGLLLRPDTTTIKNHSDAMIYFLHTITSSNYNAFKSEAGGGIGIPDIIDFSGDYSQFSTSLKRYDEMEQSAQKYRNSSQIMTQIVSDNARAAFNECIKAHNKARKEKKNLVVILESLPDQNAARVNISWTPPGTSPADVPVKGSQIVSGGKEGPPFIPNGTILVHNSWRHIIIPRKPGASISVTLDIEGESATATLPPDKDGIFKAIADNNVEAVRSYLDADVSPNVTDRSGETAFFAAVGDGKDEIVKAMLDHSPDVNFVWHPTTSAYTPLIAAAIGGHASTIRLLLKQPGINVNAQDKSGNSALHLACRDDQGFAGITDAVQALLEGKIDQRLRNRFEYTAYRQVRDGKPPVHNRAELLNMLAPIE